MILILSCFITHDRQLNRYNRFDIFKYTLNSYRNIKFKSVYIFAKLDNEFLGRKKELYTLINDIFINSEIFIDDIRYETQKEWSIFMNSIKDKYYENDELVWFIQNDDHVFIDSNTKILEEGIKLLEDDMSQYKTLYFSHWPEIIRLSGKNNTQSISNNYIKFTETLVDAIQIFNFKYLYYILCENNINYSFKRIDHIVHLNYNEERAYRPNDHTIRPIDQTIYVPLKELCRHFDGYNHVGIPLHTPPCECLQLPDDGISIQKIDNTPEMLRARMTVPHSSIWTANNEFIIPEEWIQIMLKLYNSENKLIQ
jgi:hypothetical protein